FHWWRLIMPLLFLILLLFALVTVLRPKWWAWRPPLPTNPLPATTPQPSAESPPARDDRPPSPEEVQTAQGDNPPHRSLIRLAWRYRFVLLIVSLLSVYAVSLVWHGRPPRLPRHGELLFFFERATNLASGVSPVLPILLLGLAFYFWGYLQLKRLYLLESQPANNPFPSGELFEQVNKRHQGVEKDLQAPKRAINSKFAWIVWLALWFTFCRIANHFVPSVDGIVTESILLLALAALSVLIVYGLLHLLKVWNGMRELLRAIAFLPLGD